MLPKDYIENVLKTESTNFADISTRIRNISNIRLLHASLGLNTEQAEFADALKKYIFYGKEIDEINLVEELGDLLWYIAIACNELCIDMEDVMARNIAKLHERYGIKFNKKGAINRDLSAERCILEKDTKEATYPREILDVMLSFNHISQLQYNTMMNFSKERDNNVASTEEDIFSIGTEVCAACQPSYSYRPISRKCRELNHTVFTIKDVTLNHGGKGNHYYHAECLSGPALGARTNIYHNKIVLMDKRRGK